MPSMVDKVKQRVADARERRPLLDQVVRTVEHYGAVKGNIQAGAVTYFGVHLVLPDPGAGVRGHRVRRPGLRRRGERPRRRDQLGAPRARRRGRGRDLPQRHPRLGAGHPVGRHRRGPLLRPRLAVEHAGRADRRCSSCPQREQPNFIVGKIRDLIALALLGVVLIVSVGVSGVVRGLSEQILDWVGLGSDLGWLLGADRRRDRPGRQRAAVLRPVQGPRRSRTCPAGRSGRARSSAPSGSRCSSRSRSCCCSRPANSPAFQAFGIALILVVWINYFSRVVMYAAAWAYVHPDVAALRPKGAATVEGPPSPPLPWRERLAADREDRVRGASRWATPFAAGSAAHARPGRRAPEDRREEPELAQPIAVRRASLGQCCILQQRPTRMTHGGREMSRRQRSARAKAQRSRRRAGEVATASRSHATSGDGRRGSGDPGRRRGRCGVDRTTAGSAAPASRPPRCVDCAGATTPGSSPSNLTDVDGTLFFTASDARGSALWRSNGTAGGTVLLKRLDVERLLRRGYGYSTAPGRRRRRPCSSPSSDDDGRRAVAVRRHQGRHRPGQALRLGAAASTAATAPRT